MRKILIILALALGTWMAQAQQALHDPRQAETAVVNPDRSVTIRVYAPRAYEVRLEGELTGRSVVMNRDTVGLWTYTTPALAPDLYLYYLTIDGVRALDPGNTYVARDIASLFNYVLVEDYVSTEIPHGTVEHVWYPSEGYANGRRMTVYLPAGYDTNKGKYPVLYLLHGSGGDEQAWIELGRTAQILDKQIAAGKAKPMIVVMPNGNMSEDAAPGYGRKGDFRPGVPEEHRKDGFFEERFPEIIRYVDSHYRTIRDAKHRAIAGLSMGGYHTYWIAINNPKTFHYVAPFSAVFHWDDMPQAIYQNEEKKLTELFKENPVFHVYIGNRDFLYDENVRQRAEMDRMGLKYEYTESGGGHQWKNWRRYLEDWVTEIF